MTGRKKIIITIITMVLSLLPLNVKAVNLGKPTEYGLYLYDNPFNNPSGGGSWLMANQNIQWPEVMLDINDDTEKFWKPLSNNNSSRLAAGTLKWNFPQVTNTSMILDFKYAYETNLIQGDVNIVNIATISAVYKNSGGNTQCGIVGSDIQGMTNNTIMVYEVKCIVEKEVDYLWIVFQVNGDDYTENDFYIGEDSVIREPVSNQELYDTQKQIEEGIQNQTNIIENVIGTGSYTYSADISNYSWAMSLEDTLIDRSDDYSTSILTDEVDNNANTIIWTWAGRAVNLQSKIFTMYMVILSLGVVKLLLGR